MFDYLQLPSSEAQRVEEILQLQQTAQEFRMEVEHRQAHEQYCQWYYDMARQTQADAAAMENDLDFFSWFCRRRA